jgi:hypothetical protein
LNGVILAKSDKSLNNLSAFSTLHNIVVKLILACSRLLDNPTIALPIALIHQIITAGQIKEAKAHFMLHHIPSNFFCNLLVASSPVFLKFCNCLLASVRLDCALFVFMISSFCCAVHSATSLSCFLTALSFNVASATFISSFCFFTKSNSLPVSLANCFTCQVALVVSRFIDADISFID